MTRIMVVTNRLNCDNAGSPWLWDDLIAELLRRDPDVSVHTVVLGGSEHSCAPNHPRLSVSHIAPTDGKLGRLARMRSTRLLARAVGVTTVVRRLARSAHYDLVLMPTVAAQYGGALRTAQASGLRTAIVFWDFFPVHHREIGSLPVPALFDPVLKAAERWAIGAPTRVFVMSERNAEFFSHYFGGSREGMSVLRPWAADGVSSASPDGSARFRRTVLFGGQLTKGRGLDALIDAAALLKDSSSVRILIAGDGPDGPRLQAKAAAMNLDNVEFLGSLPREEYSEVARSVDFGIAITVPGVSVPSFPSKIADYLRVGTPVIVCAEDASDVGQIVQDAGCGISVPAGDVEALANVVASSVEMSDEDRRKFSRRAREFFERELSVSVAASQILEFARSATRG